MQAVRIKLLIILVFALINSCSSEGYGNIQFYYFYDSKFEVERDLLKILRNRTDTIPSNWKEYAVPFDFMDDKLIYFKKEPQEILRVGFTGDSIQWKRETHCKLSIYGLFKGDRWLFNQDISLDERERIKKRLESEILSQMSHQYSKEDDKAFMNP